MDFHTVAPRCFQNNVNVNQWFEFDYLFVVDVRLYGTEKALYKLHQRWSKISVNQDVEVHPELCAKHKINNK